MAGALIRDSFAFLSLIILFFTFTQDPFYSNDAQWKDSIEYLTPIYILSILSLCGMFFFRSTFFKIKSAVGPKYLSMDTSSVARKSVKLRVIASWVMLLMALFFYSEGMNHFQESFEYVEYSDTSSIESETEIVVECEYNEECVAANILDDSLLFSFLAPEDMKFDAGDPTEYKEVTGIFTPLVLIILFWYLSFFYLTIYDFILKKKPTEFTPLAEWREYYEKKSYHSYGAFLLCFASLFPTLFLVSNKSQSLTVQGALIIFSAMVLIYYIVLYFYSYRENNFYDLKVKDSLRLNPAFGMGIALIIAFVYGIFSSPLDNATDIWFYDWIIGSEDHFSFYSDSESYRYRIADLLFTGLTVGLVAAVLFRYMEATFVDNSWWFFIPLILLLVSLPLLLLGVYGFIAMIIIEVISLNLVWVAPLILLAALWLFFWLSGTNQNLFYHFNNLNIAKPIAQSSPPTANPGLQWLSSQGQANFANTPKGKNPRVQGSKSNKGQQNPSIPNMNPVMGQALAEFPQWSESQIQGYFDKGWDLDGLREWILGNTNSLQMSNPKLSRQMQEPPPPIRDQSTQMLSSEKVVESPRTVTVDSKGVTTIETGFSKVTLNKLTDEVTKVPLGTDQHEMFIQEIKNMIHLESKGFDVGLIEYDDGANPKIVTRYMGPSKLSDHYKTLSARGKKKMIGELVGHVSDIHKCGMVHRDLKPDNILVDARPRDGSHQFDAIIDYGIAMKINRKQIESYNTAATKFFGHPSQKDPNFNASTGQDWFSLARIFALIIRGVDIDSLNAEIQISQSGLEMRNDISSLGFNDSVTDSISELIILATNPKCDENATIGQLAKTGKVLSKLF